MAGLEAQLKAFYELRAREEPEIDREAKALLELLA
jgi:hypothetical protein